MMSSESEEGCRDGRTTDDGEEKARVKPRASAEKKRHPHTIGFQHNISVYYKPQNKIRMK